MGRNHEVTTVHDLLDENGELSEPGWSRRLLQRYDRSRIKAPAWRIKEWDYYLVLNKDFAGAFTISDDGYIGLQSVSLIEFGDNPWEHTETVLNALPMGKIRLPSDSSTGSTTYSDGRLQMSYEVTEGQRHITCSFDNFFEGKPFKCDIILRQPDMDTMVIATPWDEKRAFYYNQKINTMRASGYMEYDGKKYEFDPKTDFGTLDWGRGVWTYDNTWYWGSGNCDIDGNAFGFNIGYGFGNTSAATENVLFYNGKVHKLDDVTFHLPESGYTDPWKITSSDGRFEMDFIPVLDRAAYMNFKIIASDQHQVFGKMTGKAVLDDGTVIEIKDMMCFAEKVHNKF
ncbi:DUF2804 domain-containing protein [Butyrivibrio sp. DSM 10294]|uniref:DUF2804 domain-containing protein n=1 Tax=Butyrivibrio sp. DSM 10294 TaxID=2972457 RepID=UPI00234EAF4A|nr:DUF2804 domain-containing protein [Butyrivibrio sp. DSM 10294]MDC7294431.1 DUF2804 domain-containing protein [Butyrivibrio sp. DSM 10294]